MDPVRIGLLGIGTVGSGTFRVLERNREEITRRIMTEIAALLHATPEPAVAAGRAGAS